MRFFLMLFDRIQTEPLSFILFLRFFFTHPAPGVPAASDQGNCGEAHRH